MKDLYETGVLEEVLSRISRLTPDSSRQWGKMNIAQMMAHCTSTLEVAAGEKTNPRSFLGRIFGSFAKASFVGDKPFPKNSPTDKNFIIHGDRNFDLEKSRLTGVVTRFSRGGAAGCTRHPHSFFGPMTPMEWSHSMYKHLDHHLRQFSV